MTHKDRYVIYSYPHVIEALLLILPFLEEYLLPYLLAQQQDPHDG